MNPEMFAKLLQSYRSVMDRTGCHFKCLQDGSIGEDSFSSETDGDSIVVRINGPLDGYFGSAACDVIAALDAADPKEIMLLIESPGGFVSEGIALYSDLMARAKAGVKISTESRGVVASAAVLPYLAGDVRTMGDGAMIMVHNPWVFMMAIGDYEDVEKTAGATINGLKAHTENYAKIVSDRTGMKQADAKSAMGKETWYASDAAKSAGFAQEITEKQMSELDRNIVAQATIRSAGNILAKYKA